MTGSSEVVMIIFGNLNLIWQQISQHKTGFGGIMWKNLEVSWGERWNNLHHLAHAIRGKVSITITIFNLLSQRTFK
jgi:hypothetical protein